MATTSKLVDQNILKSSYTFVLDYALQVGVKLPTTITLKPDEATIESYNMLIAAVAPATPQSIMFVSNHVIKSKEEKWYEISIFRKCLIITLLALIVLITVSLSPVVDVTNQSAGLLASSGKVLLLNLLFICSSALLGVMFFILKSLNFKIKAYTLLPVDIIELNMMIIIGVISGFVVAELFTFTSVVLGGNIELHKMTLALLGGFSSDAIFTILQGIVSKVKTFLTPGFSTDSNSVV